MTESTTYIQNDIEYNIKQAVTSLLHRHAFYGYLVQMLQWQEDNNIPTLATNGVKIYYNKDFFNQLTVQERVFAIAHEIFHCMVDSVGRVFGRDAAYWNMASDYAINASLRADGVGSFIEGCLYEKKYENMSADEIYEDLVKNKSQKKETFDTHLKIGKNPIGDTKDGSNTVQEGPGGKTGFEEKIIKAAQFTKGLSGGKLPSGVEFILKNIISPKINWRTLLQTSIQSLFKSDITWQRRDIMTPDKRFILPSVKMEETVEICVSLDTSGSISDEMRDDFLGEIMGILKYYKDFKLNIWCFDTEVHNFQSYNGQNIHKLKEYQAQGGGGTSIECNFDFMKAKRIRPKQFICFTDGYNCSKNWGPNNFCSTTWIIHSNSNPEVPFGRWTNYNKL